MKNTRGLTLVEVLAATALFAILGTLLFQIMQGALDVWSRGERVRELEERANAVLELVAADLRHTWPGGADVGEQDARFLVLPRELDLNGDGASDADSTLLGFTRLLYEQRSLPWLRRAGERPLADGRASLVGVERPEELMPTGGLADTVYALVAQPDEPLPGLVRCLRTPIGTLLDPEELERPDAWLGEAVRLADGVLRFDVECWGPATTSWAPAPEGSGEPPLALWDSTRGMVSTFAHAAAGPSRTAGHDDIVPRSVRLTLVLDAHDEPPGRLAESVGPDAGAIRLRGALTGDVRRPTHLWVDGEWMEVVDGDGRTWRVVRGPVARTHDAGAEVRVGRRYERVVAIPAARENFNR